jgi:DNA helicase-2/ATP-dependent DNA helicase PcrA
MPPTPEQKHILDANDRLRLVRAAPGSGKTWLIAEAIRREINGWRHRHRGIAAISFTNVARDEIHNKLGFEPGHPHFIGTLDSFLFRYIVRPFARLRDPQLPEPRIVPGIIAPHMVNNQRWCTENIEVALLPGRFNIFNINIVGGTRQNPRFVVMQRTGTPYQLSDYEAQLTIQKKRRIWRTSGRVSHSDTAYMASLILDDPSIGPSIVALLVRRFPKMFLDEVQDTGWFLSRAVLRILTDHRINGLVVGDPDQAIYEFNGASPRIFDELAVLNGSGSYEINTSLRCPNGICTLARSLSSEHRPLISNTGRAGRVIIAIHDGEENLPRELLSAITQSDLGKVHRLVTRKNSMVRRLNGRQTRNFQNFRSKPIENMHNAVNALRSCRPKEALSLAEASVSGPLLGTDSPSDRDLKTIGADEFLWKKTVIKTLLNAEHEEQGETIYQWGCAVRDNIVTALTDKGWWGLVPKRRAPNRPNRAATEGVNRSQYLVQKRGNGQAINLMASTVHAVKGETHDTTILFVPRPDRHNPCPSGIWWSDEELNAEERRIAYVAATRARETFILCVHRQTFEALQETQPEFVAVMECVELGDLVARYLEAFP